MSQFNDPASGDFINFNDVLDALLLFTVYEETEEHQTVHGPNTAVIADVVVLDGDQAGTVYNNAPIYPRALKPQLRKSIGGFMVLGRLSQGNKKPGQNPAWTLLPSTDADKKLAQAYVDSHGHPAEVKAEKAAAAERPF
jgi:hypothetical protein